VGPGREIVPPEVYERGVGRPRVLDSGRVPDRSPGERAGADEASDDQMYQVPRAWLNSRPSAP
jgi:hypothetical protein